MAITSALSDEKILKAMLRLDSELERVKEVNARYPLSAAGGREEARLTAQIRKLEALP